MTRILPVNPGSPQEEVIRQAGEELISGNVIALPTDTIYGLCAHALDQKAIEKLYEIKGRKDEKGAPVLIGCRTQLKGLADDISPRAVSLMDSLWPSGLTLVLPASPNLSHLAGRRRFVRRRSHARSSALPYPGRAVRPVRGDEREPVRGASTPKRASDFFPVSKKGGAAPGRRKDRKYPPFHRRGRERREAKTPA